MNQRERAVLTTILDASIPGATALAEQLDAARVPRNWGNTPSIDIDVPQSGAPTSHVSTWVFPVNAVVVDDQEQPVGEIIVWVDRGRLGALEFAWYLGDDAPTTLPPPRHIIVTPKNRTGSPYQPRRPNERFRSARDELPIIGAGHRVGEAERESQPHGASVASPAPASRTTLVLLAQATFNLPHTRANERMFDNLASSSTLSGGHIGNRQEPRARFDGHDSQ